MRIQSTLKRSGGVATRLKVNWKRIGITVLAMFAGYMMCRMLFVMLDQFMNGFFVDWFENNFVRLEWHEITGTAKGYYYKSIRWGAVKELLLVVLIVLILLIILAVRVISILYAADREKKALHKAGVLIGDYMHHDREVGEVFPAEYAEVSARMAEIKSGVQRQEQLLREEASRKNDLITYLAHDLKTPLTSVVGYLSLLEEAPDMPPQQKARYVNIALDKALRL